MTINKQLNTLLKVVLSVCLGGAILYWMYRDFDFQQVRHVALHEMNWTWMLLSFPFGVLAQSFRGWRWRQTLEPMGQRVRSAVTVRSIYLSYAVSLVVPRLGEFVRCGVLRSWDGTDFPKSLGTVVTERAIDSLVVLMVVGVTLVSQFAAFDRFFQTTGTRIDHIVAGFSSAGWLVTAVCGLAVVWLLWWLLRRLSVYNRVKEMFQGLVEGVLSVRHVRNVPLFVFHSLAIWVCYFLHYYLTFFCFEQTSHLGLGCALVTFVVGSIAVIVPTPNGAGPWHFAVKTMLILYGVAANDALYFVLIVHSVQTLLVVLLGVYGWIALAFTPKRVRTEAQV